MSREALTGCLVHANAFDLEALGQQPPWGDTFLTDGVAPAVDGVELVAPIAELARLPLPHAAAPPDVLAGSNLDEGTEFIHDCPPLMCNATTADFITWAEALFGPALGAAVPSLYGLAQLGSPTPLCAPGGPTTPAWLGAMRSAGDYAILCRARELLRVAAQGGGRVWWYRFEATPVFSLNFPRQALPYYGAFHGAEVPFVFGLPVELSTTGERQLSAAMGCYWTNFAATGDPNTGSSDCAAGLGLPKWPPAALAPGGAEISAPKPTVSAALLFRNTSITPEQSLKSEQCDLFAQYP